LYLNAEEGLRTTGGGGDSYRKVVTPFGRTNAFLCLVLACFNDPRAPASTDTLLSLKVFPTFLSFFKTFPLPLEKEKEKLVSGYFYYLGWFRVIILQKW
jgi:hypothetical protein